MAQPKRKHSGVAIYVSDTALLAFIREMGIADPEALRRQIALVPGLISAGKMGRRSWTVDGLTFHIQKDEGQTAWVTGVTPGPTTDLSGRELARSHYTDGGNNSIANRRRYLNRKPQGQPRPERGPTAGEFDDD